MQKSRLKPFIVWPGGKTSLLDTILAGAPKTYNRYFEPFVGGGAVLLALRPKHAVISDLKLQPSCFT